MPKITSPKLLLVYLSVAILNCGCAIKQGSAFLEGMTQERLSTCLIKNQTTKEVVQSLFGDPEEVDFVEDCQEKWTYCFKRSEAKGINYVPVASAFYSGTNDTKTQLRILFDQNGVLTNYSLSKNSGETKLGAFQ